MGLLNLVQAYFLENCVQMQKYENSLVFSNFQLVLLRTSELEFTGIWPILLRSTSLSALSAALQAWFPLDFRLSADALEEKSDLQVFWILRLPVPKRDHEGKNRPLWSQNFKPIFTTEAGQDRVQQLLQVQKSGLGSVRTQKSNDKRACKLPLGLGEISLYQF